MLPTLQAAFSMVGRTGGPVERVEPRISGDNAEPGRRPVSDRSVRHRFPTRRRSPSDYREPRCVIWCQKIADHSTDQNKPRPVGGHSKTTADLHQQ
jgi:hypothetical protein